MLRKGGLRTALLGSAATAAIISIAGPASAGGFAVREQSTEFQGMSFAGNSAAGGGLSGMFWNPAVAAYAPVGIYSESHYAAIIGRSEITGDLFQCAGAVVNGTCATGANLGATLGLQRDSGDLAKDAIVPSSYMSYRLSEKLVVALSVNSPFGLVTEPTNRLYTGSGFARTSEIKTYNFSPTLAYRLTPALAIGVGLQIEHIEGRLKSAASVAATGLRTQNFTVQGDDTAFGYTAGINWQPTSATHIGLGYRSSIDHTLEGTAYVTGNTALTGGGIRAGATLPEIVTLGLRQGINERLTLLGSIEWTHWKRLEKLDVVCANNQSPSALCPINGNLVTSLDLRWSDGWFFSLGGEYKYSDKLTLRTGLAYEVSPVRDATERPHRVPDADRVWASVGATYKWSEMMAFDVAYSHIFVDDAPIDRTARDLGLGNVRFIGHADTSVDIFSASLKIKLGGGERSDSLK